MSGQRRSVPPEAWDRYLNACKGRPIPRRSPVADIDEEMARAKGFYSQYLEGHVLLELHDKLYARVMQGGVGSAFEFGCNRGKNLLGLRARGLERVAGLDLSTEAVQLAQGIGLDVTLGDEQALTDVATDSFDCAFNCSVLCHIPTRIEFILEQLERIARVRVVLAETRQSSAFAFYYDHDYGSFGYVQADASFTPTTSMDYGIWVRRLPG